MRNSVEEFFRNWSYISFCCNCNCKQFQCLSESRQNKIEQKRGGICVHTWKVLRRRSKEIIITMRLIILSWLVMGRMTTTTAKEIQDGLWTLMAVLLVFIVAKIITLSTQMIISQLICKWKCKNYEEIRICPMQAPGVVYHVQC